MNTLNKMFDNWVSNGIFSYLARLDVPWDTSATSLNYQYHGNHSGDKIVSPLIDAISEEELTDSQKSQIARTIFDIYNASWTKMWIALTADYNPIENYDRNESTTNQTDYNSKNTLDKSGSDTLEKRGSDTTEHDTTDTDTTSGNIQRQNLGMDTDTHTDNNATTKNLNKRYAYNSESASPESENEEVKSGGYTDTHTAGITNTETYNQLKKEVKHGGDDTLRYNSDSTQKYNSKNEDSKTGFDKITINSRVHGNVGVTTNQQMIQAELELRKKSFFDTVFEQIDSVLCCKIYY